MNKYPKFKLVILALVCLFSSSAIGGIYTSSPMDCRDRLVTFNPPEFPRTTVNLYRLVRKNSGCFVDIKFLLDVKGKVEILEKSITPAKGGCSIFDRTATKYLNSTEFSEGEPRTCNIQVRFLLEPVESNIHLRGSSD